MPLPITFQTASGRPGLTVVLQLRKDLGQNATDMLYAGQRQRDRIVKRTGEGRDADGNKFKEYSEAYAARKAKSGRDSGTVDLTWSGRMLRAMVTNQVSDKGFVIGIYGEEAVRAGAHNFGLGKLPKRKFMGATQADVEQMKKDIEARCMARAKGTGLNVALNLVA